MGGFLLTVPLLGRIVDGCASLYATYMLSKRRQVEVQMVTISQLIKEKGLRCVFVRAPCQGFRFILR